MVYTYGMRLRGFSMGCQPMDGLVDWRDTDKTKTGYWSILNYNRELTKEECEQYSLDCITTD